MKTKDGRNVAVWLSVDTVEQIDRLAEKIGLTRSKMAANLVESGLEDALFLEKTGILSTALALRRFNEFVRNQCGSDPEVVKQVVVY